MVQGSESRSKGSRNGIGGPKSQWWRDQIIQDPSSGSSGSEAQSWTGGAEVDAGNRGILEWNLEPQGPNGGPGWSRDPKSRDGFGVQGPNSESRRYPEVIQGIQGTQRPIHQIQGPTGGSRVPGTQKNLERISDPPCRSHCNCFMPFRTYMHSDERSALKLPVFAPLCEEEGKQDRCLQIPNIKATKWHLTDSGGGSGVCSGRQELLDSHLSKVALSRIWTEGLGSWMQTLDTPRSSPRRGS